jgi:CubicO group peptidase (beta-lactamase class C family)
LKRLLPDFQSYQTKILHMKEKYFVFAVPVLFGLLLSLFSGCRFNTQNGSEQTLQVVSNPILDPRYQPLLDSLNHFVDQKMVPGGVALVFEKDRVVFHQPFGQKVPEEGIAFGVNDIFRLASMTKPITSVAAMMLWEEGRFALDDPLSKYIPEFENPKILERINYEDSTFTAYPAEGEIAIRQLFTFTSGLYYGFDNDSLSIIFAREGISEGFDMRDITLEQGIARLAKIPLLHEPGERYHYGLEMDVLGRLIEIWSGMPLDSFFQTRIFEPLKMTDTRFYLSGGQKDRLVKVYQSEPGGYSPSTYELVDYPVAGAQAYLSGGADLCGTAYDYYLFCHMLLNKGTLNGQTILKPETVELMTTTQLETGDNDMGLGLGILSAKTEVTSARSVGSYTWGGFFSTLFWVDPEKEIIAVLMLQMYPFDQWQINDVFETTIYQVAEDQ